MVAKSQPAFVDMTLEQANLLKVPVRTMLGSAVHLQVKEKYPNMNFVYGDDLANAFHRLRAGECVVLTARASDWDIFQRNAEVNGDCSLKWIGRAESIESAGPASKIDVGDYCTSLVMHVMNIHLYTMISDGFVKEAWRKHVESLATNQCSESDSSSTDEGGNNSSLRPIDVGGAFLVYICVCLFSITSAWFEKRRKMLTTTNLEKTSESDLEKTSDFDAEIQTIDAWEAADPNECEKDTSLYTTTVVYEIRRIITTETE